jgi:predicted MPP superfamily phosphohydrolase
MMSWRDAVIWMAVMTSVLGLGHFYVYRRLVADASLTKRARLSLLVALGLLLLLVPATFASMRSLPRSWLTVPSFVVFGWMGLLSSWFSLLVLTDVVRLVSALVARLRRRPGVRDSEGTLLPRRRALARMIAGGVALGGAALTGTGVAIAAYGFRKRRLEVTLSKLPAAFDGFKIVQVSDIHVGPTIGRDFVLSMVAAANEEQADLIAITGDLVDGTVAQLREHTAPLAGLLAKQGVYFVTGNHEYYSGADEWVTEVERLGIQVLRNRRVALWREDAAVDLAGVTDHRAGRYGDGPDFDAALEGRDETRELLLLAHQPAALSEAVRRGVGLQLSGHTHGGQFWPWNWVIYLVQPVVAGLARFGRTQVYVNAGTGYWGPPMRLGTQAEITVLTLRSGPVV